jgi:hypothetical protein
MGGSQKQARSSLGMIVPFDSGGDERVFHFNIRQGTINDRSMMFRLVFNLEQSILEGVTVISVAAR